MSSDSVLKACNAVLDPNPQPFAMARAIFDSDGVLVDMAYEYMNPAMAALSGQRAEQLKGKPILDSWPADDGTWLDAFRRCTLNGDTVEFDFVSVPLERFLHVTLYPLGEERCMFTIQDVTDWVSQAHTSLKAVKAGLFFYDWKSSLLMLTQAALDLTGLDTGYMTLVEFARKIFGPQGAREVENKLKAYEYLPEDGCVLHEGMLADGRWLQLTVGQVGQSGRFSFGVLGDVTRRKQAEVRSVRHMRIVESLGKENFALYLVDLEKDTIEPYRTKGEMSGPVRAMVERVSSYSEALHQYLEKFVGEEGREELAVKAAPQAIRATFSNPNVHEFAVCYKRMVNDNPHYLELRIICLDRSKGQVVLATRVANNEMAEQMRQKTALQEALKTAEHANQAKSTFLTNMSHDFRTPMNSISGFANMALESLGDDAKVRDCLEKILLSGNHLLNLVNDILDVSRIESGKVEMSEEEFSLIELAEELCKVFEGQAAKKDLRFCVDASAVRRPLVCSDRTRIMQILVNITGNAIKFTPPGGEVTVEVKERSAGPQSSIDYGIYVFTVRDSGIGMSAEFLEVLFNPFERAASRGGGVNEGTGLGMAITNNLVNLLGGTIKVDSAPGEGSLFTVTLPLRRAKRTQPGGHSGNHPEFYGTGHPALAEEYDFSGRRVLVVDDDMFSREIIRDVLERRGCAVEDAEDGAQAVDLVRCSDLGYYDAIIMDMRMPQMNGDEAARAIRALGRDDAASMPLVAATADAFAEVYDRVRDAGMDAHITKPLNVKTLVEVLGTLLFSA